MDGRRTKNSEKPRRKIRPNALIIRQEDEPKYQEILRRIKENGPTCVAGECVDKICKTATGDMLLIVTKGKEAGSANSAD